MADRIKLLPEVVANQIAAGEVVNRPSSVVKEMMENAIDAGARSVKVNFRDGGKELIQIVDDGCGMSPIDARMAFDRHATSKISSLDDIYALKTFGFRGEALASIAAVSQVELRTRQAEDEVGTLTTVNGGEFVSQTLAACPVGSQFYVRNLFYNVPARRKFLEKSTTSTGQIKSEFQRVALCNPQVGFELLMNDQPLYRLPAASLASRIVDVGSFSVLLCNSRKIGLTFCYDAENQICRFLTYRICIAFVSITLHIDIRISNRERSEEYCGLLTSAVGTGNKVSRSDRNSVYR